MDPPRLRHGLAAAALALLAAPGAAAAHLRVGTVAVGVEASVSSPRPSADAPFVAGVYASDLALHLTVRPGHTVVVLGYLGEPFLRLGPAGVAVNAGSPTAAAAGLLGRSGRPAPGDGWRLRRGRDSAAWHDTRVDRLRPGERDGRWRVPLVVDGRRAAIAGEIRRLPAPARWPWLAFLAVCVGCTAFLGATATPARLAAGCRLLGAAAGASAAATALAFALDAYASPGTWVASADEAVFIGACALALVLAPPPWRVAAGMGLGLLGLAVGLSELPVFLRADVLSLLPGATARVLAAVAIGAGGAAAALGGLWFTREGGRLGENAPPVSPA